MGTEKMGRYTLEQVQHERDSRLISDILSHELAEKIFRWVQKEGIEEIYKGVHEMSCVPVTGENAPEIREMAERASQMFGLERAPDLYLRRGYEESVEVCGLNRPFLLISSDFLELVLEEDRQMLFGMIAGRIAGIKAGHSRGRMLFWIMETVIQYFPVPNLVIRGLDALLNEWNRCRYFTYDRAFYLATGDEGLALRSLLIHLAPGETLDRFRLGEPQDQYEAQARRFEESAGLDGAVKLLNSMSRDDPWIPERWRELKKFGGGVENGSGFSS